MSQITLRSALVVLTALVAAGLAFPLASQAAEQSPSFSCSTKKLTSVEEMICASEELSALDREIASAYTRQLARSLQKQKATVRAAQKKWLRERDRCETAWNAASGPGGAMLICLSGEMRSRLDAIIDATPGRQVGNGLKP